MTTQKDKILKKLNEKYHFSQQDNIIKKDLISPKEFLRITMIEGRNNYIRSQKNKLKTFSKKERKKLKFMPPEYSFLPIYEDTVLFKHNVEGIKEVLKGKKQSKYGIPIPFLEFKNNKPVGHEGRHTAKALYELGINKMPVTKVIKKY